MLGSMNSSPRSLYTKPFILAAAANFLFFSNLNAYTLLPLYIQQLGGREGQIGMIMAMYSVAAILCQLGVGPLVDRFGRKPFIVFGAAAITVVSTVFVFSTQLGWHFYLLRFLQGLAFAAFTTSNLTLLADLVPASRRAEAVGIFGVSGLVTIALAPAFGEAILRAFGFPVLFAGSVLLGVGAFSVCLATEVPRPAGIESAQPLGRGFWQSFMHVMLSGFQFGLANSIVFVFLPPFARFAGVPRIAPFYIVYTLMAVAVRVLGGRLADRLERRQVILPSLIGLAAGILLFSTLHSTWMLVLIAFINGTAHGFVFPATSALAFDRAPRGARGRALAVFNTAVLAGTTTGAMGFGWCAEIVGYRAGFVAFGLALAAGSAVFWRKR
ncbi:MAG: putative transport protein, belonging to the Major Facilitator Superfamily, of which narK is a er [candidate division NC10 bacterium]|nr:putative transport protein, belonging to the Major Facilitator Superfamily, of which narK is a er [candidate division NC10 bacterium]MBS1115863.1 putative transport protein, belonging to the Major Facilitator Superfamily, of which narK is a er [candidate division NC10 bacterium]